MAYNADKQFETVVNELEPKAQALLNAIREGKAAYEEWQSLRDARSDDDIATAFVTNGRATTVAADVAQLDVAFSVFDSVQRYLDNDTPPAGIDQGFSLRVFS